MAKIEERAFQFAFDKCNCRNCNVQCKINDIFNMDGTCDEYNKHRKLYKEIATGQDRIARQEERERAELVFCSVCERYDCCDQRYDCNLFNKFSKAMEKGGE